MATLDSSSTLADVQAAYDDNASYAEEASISKARAFVTACRILLRRVPKMTGSREAQLTLSPELLQKEMQAAQEWLSANGGNAAPADAVSTKARTVSFESFR